MAWKCTQLFVYLVLVDTATHGFTQDLMRGVYQDCSKENVMECVMDFTFNRSEFKSFECYMQSDLESVSQIGLQRGWEQALVFENGEKRRTDKRSRAEGLTEDGEGVSVSPIFTAFASGESVRYFMHGREDPAITAAKEGRLHFVPDPWMVVLMDEGKLAPGREEGKKDYWQKIFDETRLLRQQTNGAFVRSEWHVGRGEGQCNVQIYFSKGISNLPVFVRYLLPRDKEQAFSSDGMFISENQIKWVRHRSGYAPLEVSSHTELRWKSKPGVRATYTRVTRFFWESSLYESKKGTLLADVFVPGKLKFLDLLDSFKTDASRKR